MPARLFLLLAAATPAAFAAASGAPNPGPGPTHAAIAAAGAMPTVTITDCAIPEGTGGTRECHASVVTSAASDLTISVDVMTFDVTATAGEDYHAVARTLTFPPGARVETVPVAIVTDAVPEPDESFELRLSNPVNVSIADGVATGSIGDDDSSPGTLQFTSGPTRTFFEASATVFVSVARLGGTVGAVSVPYTIAPGTATPGVDYTAQDGVLNWGPTEAGLRTILVTLTDDAAFEARETLVVALQQPSGGAVLGSPSSVTVMIEDDEDFIMASDFERSTGRN